MTTLYSFLFALLGILSAARVSAAPGDIDKLLEQQRQHGFTSPVLAAQELEELSEDLAGQPLALRMRYHNQLATLYIGAENHAKVAASLSQLERMASTEQCTACGHYKTVRLAQQAIRAQDIKATQALLAKLEAIASADPELMQAVHYLRGSAYDATGSHARAIDEGLLASQLAMKGSNPAEQVRSLNLLMLANVGRRDLVRAESLSKEAFALAQRIGYVYMMAYIRSNSAWIYSLMGEREKQLAALTDALGITRAHPGMDDSQLAVLVNLAVYHGEQSSFDQAAELALQAIALADQQKKPIAKGVAMITLGEARMKLGQSDKGLQTLQEAVDLLNQAGAKS